MSNCRTIFLFISIFTFLLEVRATKLDGHHHHHDGHHHDHGHDHSHDHHHDHNHDHHDHGNNHQMKDTSFILNEDIFAKALAAEVHHGLFSPLPKLSNTIPQGANNLRGTAKFRTPLGRAGGHSKKATSEKSLISGINQEIPTPITSQQHTQLRSVASRPVNRLRSINNSLRRTTTRGTVQFTTEQPTTYKDDSGFAPRAPPPTAKQFNPFSANQNAVQQQVSKFQFRSPKKVGDNTGFAPRAPPATAKQFNPVPTKKANSFQFARSESSAKSVVDTTGFAPVAPPPTAKQFNPFAGVAPVAQTPTAKQFSPAPSSSASSDTTGFAPVAPPATAQQFNPVPGGSDDWATLTTLNFDQDSTTALSTDYFSTNYDTDYDYEGNTYDYDQNSVDTGKSLQESFEGVNQATENPATFDYPTQAHTLSHNDANLGNTASDPRNQQINVLGALSSSGNVLNSPKYNSNNVHSDVTDEIHQEAHFSATTLRSTFVNSGFQIVTARNSIEFDESLGIDSKEIGSNILAFESGNNLGRNIPASGGGGVALPGLKSGDATLPPTTDGAALQSRTTQGAALGIGQASGAEVQPEQVGNALQTFDYTDAGAADNTLLGRQLGAGGGDEDYPQYSTVPPTSFRCEDHQYSGYYADPETQCQGFHICLHSKNLGSFLCPNGTLFHQQLFVCDWWYNVRCDEASLSYDLNKLIGAQDQVLQETQGVEEEAL